MSIDVTIIGVPIDCTRRFTEVKRMPLALRNVDLVSPLDMADMGGLTAGCPSSARRRLPDVDGLYWNEVAALVKPMAHSGAMIGTEVSIYNPTLDPGAHVRRTLSPFA